MMNKYKENKTRNGLVSRKLRIIQNKIKIVTNLQNVSLEAEEQYTTVH